MSQTRSSLLSRIKNLGDGLSWEEFDAIYRPLLLRYALARGLGREQAEEIAQTCMASIAGGIQDFQRRVSFRGWLRGMVDHKVADHFRKLGRETAAATGDFDQVQGTEENPALIWERQWNRTHLLYCLNQVRGEVAPMTYQAFEMYVLWQLPVKEIVERLDMTPNQIYLAKHRVIARLKNRWTDLGDGLF